MRLRRDFSPFPPPRTEKYGRRTHACGYILLCDLISYQNYSTERESESNLGREGEAGRGEREHILIQVL